MSTQTTNQQGITASVPEPAGTPTVTSIEPAASKTGKLDKVIKWLVTVMVTGDFLLNRVQDLIIRGVEWTISFQ